MKVVSALEKKSAQVSMIVRDQARWETLLAAKKQLETGKSHKILEQLIEMWKKEKVKNVLDL